MDKFLEAKRKQVEKTELSKAYCDNISTRLNRFARDFNLNIKDVTKVTIMEWLDAADLNW